MYKFKTKSTEKIKKRNKKKKKKQKTTQYQNIKPEYINLQFTL